MSSNEPSPIPEIVRSQGDQAREYIPDEGTGCLGIVISWLVASWWELRGFLAMIPRL